MAGSYQHCMDDNAGFSFDLIENMGDAHEACEHMFYMIAYLADDDPHRIDAASEDAYNRIYPHHRGDDAVDRE